eukprot:scaffold53098_cov24-Tisochrysis_lutea.AAC.2
MPVQRLVASHHGFCSPVSLNVLSSCMRAALLDWPGGATYYASVALLCLMPLPCDSTCAQHSWISWEELHTIHAGAVMFRLLPFVLYYCMRAALLDRLGGAAYYA